jgi:hypothetical protein
MKVPGGKPFRRWSEVLLVLVLAGCGPADDRAAAEEASARLSELLYSQNLVGDPEVNAKMNEHVLAVSRDGAPADSVMADFHRWLARWVRANPDRAAAARLGAHGQ